jgi:hypothetical protein
LGKRVDSSFAYVDAAGNRRRRKHFDVNAESIAAALSRLVHDGNFNAAKLSHST